MRAVLKNAGVAVTCVDRLSAALSVSGLQSWSRCGAGGAGLRCCPDSEQRGSVELCEGLRSDSGSQQQAGQPH